MIQILRWKKKREMLLVLAPEVVPAVIHPANLADIKVDTKSLPKNCPSENLLKEVVADGRAEEGPCWKNIAKACVRMEI
jgi:hypothetical protein